MVKHPVGHFVGYHKFAIDKKFLAEERDRKAQKSRDAWHSKWITVWRLKQERLWTDGAIKRWLGEPESVGKYKVFSVDSVKVAERKKAFKDWLKPRVEKKLLSIPYFEITKLK